MTYNPKASVFDKLFILRHLMQYKKYGSSVAVYRVNMGWVKYGNLSIKG